MKRVLSILLALIVTMSVGTAAAAAKSGASEPKDVDDEQHGLYLSVTDDDAYDFDSPLFSRFMEWGGEQFGNLNVDCFHELFTQKDEEGKTQWAILEARLGAPDPWEVKYGNVIAGRFIYSIGGFMGFESGYAFYDAATDAFCELTSVVEEAYPGLREAMQSLALGNPFGDADLDGKVTILDATRIQRTLAKLDYLEFIIPSKVAEGREICSYAYADMDGDGKISILDATCIQRVLAGLPITKA